MRVIIAAAGTGGHITPGIAIANTIKKEEKDSEIIFVGTDRGLENDLVPRAGYELKKIHAYGISREFTLKNIKRMYKTILGIGEAKKIVKEFKPDVVIGTGGYISGPMGLAAKKYKVPLVLHESNAFPGMTVKLLSKKANLILVGFEDALKRLPKAKKVVVTGTPTKVVEMHLTDLQKEKIRQELKLDSTKKTVLVVGGSQGAKSINESLLGLIQEKKSRNYQIVWATGHSGYEAVKKQIEANGNTIDALEDVRIVPYVYNMSEILNMVDLVIARSGAMTITEISIVGKPAIFIPFPNAAENHQEYNAKVLVNAGAARMILDKDLTAERLETEIEEIIQQDGVLQQMGNKAKTIAKDNVENRIYQEIKKIVKK